MAEQTTAAKWSNNKLTSVFISRLTSGYKSFVWRQLTRWGERSRMPDQSLVCHFPCSRLNWRGCSCYLPCSWTRGHDATPEKTLEYDIHSALFIFASSTLKNGKETSPECLTSRPLTLNRRFLISEENDAVPRLWFFSKKLVCKGAMTRDFYFLSGGSISACGDDIRLDNTRFVNLITVAMEKPGINNISFDLVQPPWLIDSWISDCLLDVNVISRDM